MVDVDTPLPHLQKGWIPNTRKFLRESNSKLGFVESENIKQMREHDRVIMQDAVRSPLLTKTEVSEINFCRLYLQVETIADMATLDGTRIHEGCFADEPACLSTSNKKWPIQGKPGREQWKKFSLYMRRTYCRTEKEWVLRVRLKDWYPEVYQRRNWSCYYTPEHEVITMYEEDKKFRMYQVTKTRAIQMGGIIATECFAEGTEFNGVGIPTDTNENGRCIISKRVGQEECKQDTPESFTEYMSRIADWEKELIGDNEAEEGGLEAILELLEEEDGHRSIVGASDGGLRKRRREYGSQGWLIATHDAKVLWRGSGPAPGAPNSSYRAQTNEK